MPLIKKSSTAPVAETPKTEIATPAQLAQVVEIKKSIGKAVAKAASSEVMTKADWSAKDRRISRQGLFQSCLGSVGLLQLNVGNDLKSYLDIVRQAADEGLKYVNEAE